MNNQISDACKSAKVISQKAGKMNKDNIIIAVVVAVIILAVVGIMCYYFLFRDNEIVATYDDGKVTRGEYEIYYRAFAPMLSYYGYTPEAISKYIAEKIILDRLVIAEAKANGITLTEDKKKEVDTLFEDEANVKEFSNRGIEIEPLRTLFYDDSIINSYIEKLQKEAKSEEVKAFIIETEGEDADLNIYNTRHILFQTTTDMTADEKAAVKKEAEDVLARVNEGEDFATLAKEYSDDTYTEQYSEGKYQAKTSTTVASYMSAVKNLTAGKHTNYLVEDESYGYFIIKLESVSENGRLTDTTDVGYYVDDILYEKQQAANCKYRDEKINAIAASLSAELGIVTTEAPIATK